MSHWPRLVAIAGGFSLVLIASLAGSPTSAQEPTIQDLVRALEERDRALEERDKVIADLLKRVGALERANAPATQSPDAAEAAAVGAEAPPAEIRADIPPTRRTPEEQPATEHQDEQPGPVADAKPETEGDERDADLAARALERTLVERGALLLPVWGAEVAPSLTYAHKAVDAFALFPDERIGTRTRSDTVDAALTFRLGLPWESQVEVRAPWSYVREEVVIDSTARADDDFGPGDVQLTISRQLLREDGWLPNLLASASWKTTTGSDPFDTDPGAVALGTGFDEITGTLSAVKSRDPLVFFGSVSYTEALADETRIGRIDPGNAWGLSFGTVLAVSPDTSLSFSLSSQFRDELSLEGEQVAGTDQTTAVLQIGAAVLLSPRTLLNVTVGVGLTEDSSDFQIGVSLPVRFSL